jgi:uncharacterized surface protein with fasciclin (FAS1) repeats
MVSIGPNSQSFNMSHMWHIPDLRRCKTQENEPLPNSLWSVIQSNPDFSKFKYMVELAKFESIFNDLQANFTLFIPSDQALIGINENIFINMDDSTARHIIKTSTLERKIPSEILEASPASYFITRSAPNKLFITNISNITYINNCINIIYKDWECSNGIIHVIDKLILPKIMI